MSEYFYQDNNGEVQYHKPQNKKVKTHRQHLEEKIVRQKKSITFLIAENKRLQSLNKALKEKQVPKAVVIHEGLNEIRCPSCNAVFCQADCIEYEWTYCQECGQKLKWEGDAV